MTALRTPTQESGPRMPRGLSPTGKLVYLYLSERGSTSVENLKEALDVPQIRLYPTLESLENRALVDRIGDEFVVQG